MASSLAVLCVILLLSALLLTDSKENRRVTKEVEDKVKKLDPATKKRILAMDAAGMPRDAIAHSLNYISGNNKQTAHGIINGVKVEAQKQKQKQELKKSQGRDFKRK
jgi:hypothetical protein